MSEDQMPAVATSLLEQRIAWEKANPWPEQLRRAEKAIVVALNKAEFGQQCQVTKRAEFSIAVDDLIVRVEHCPDSALPEIDRLRAENQRLRDLYENVVNNREAFGWTINHLLECEEALRTVEGAAGEAMAQCDRLRRAGNALAARLAGAPGLDPMRTLDLVAWREAATATEPTEGSS